MKITGDFNVAAIVLAAGEGSRFGSQKMLHVERGKTLLSHALDALDKRRFSSISIVVGANADAVKMRHLDNSLNFIDNPEWQTGIGSSIAKGVKTVTEAHSELDAVLILLGDQIYIRAEMITDMLAHSAQNPSRIICANYQNTCGVPCIFPSSFFGSLQQLASHRGAKSVLRHATEPPICITMPEAALDIDRLEDLENNR